MTNYFLNPLGSRRWLPNNALGSGGTHSAMLTGLGQQFSGDEISAISAATPAAAAIHDQSSVTRKSYDYYHQGGGDNFSGFLVHQDPLAALARGKYASSNLLLPQTVAATTTSSYSSSPPPHCGSNSASSVVAVNDFGCDAGDYLMRSVDSLVGAASPQSHDTFLSFIKSHEDRINTEESDSVTVNSFFSAPGDKQAAGAKGFELSTKICGDDDAILTSPGVIQTPTAAAAVDDAADAGMMRLQQRASVEPMEVVLAQSLESSLGDKFADNFLESIEEDLKASFGHQESGDGSLDQENVVQDGINLPRQQQQQESASYGTQQGRAPAGMSIPWSHEEQQCNEGAAPRSNSWSTHPLNSVVPSPRFPTGHERDSHEGDERLLRLLREAAGDDGLGSSKDEIADVRDGQARNLHQNSSTFLKQSSGQSLHISSSRQYPPSSSHRVAFPEDVAMASPPNQILWPRIGAKPSGGTHGLRARDDTPAAPLQLPNVQNLAANRGSLSSSSSQSPAAETRVSDRHETLKWLGTPGNCRNSNAVTGASQMKSVAARHRAHDDHLLAPGTSNHSPLQNTTPNSNPCPSQIPSASLAQSPFKSQGSSSKPLNDVLAENQAQKRRPYSEINGLVELMSTENKPYLEIAALDTTTINSTPSRALYKIEDALKIAVSNTIATKRRFSGSQANQQQQQHDSNKYQSSKKQKVMRKPSSPSAAKRELQCHSRVPEEFTPPAAAELERPSTVPEGITPPAAAELECHSRVPGEIMPTAAELECHSRVPKETTLATAELGCHSRVPEIIAAPGDSWISNESTKDAMPQMVVVNMEDSMGVEYWENLLAAGFAGEHDDCNLRQNQEDDDFVNVGLNAMPQSPLSDFSSGMAMLFDYL